MSTLRTLGFFKPSVLGGIDALGPMMIAIMILIFGPLATVKPADVSALAGPLVIAFVFGPLGSGSSRGWWASCSATASRCRWSSG